MPPRRFALILTAAALAAQTPERPKLANDGAPLRMPLACGVEEILHFGLTCPADQSCPVYLELAAVASTGPRLFLSGNLHTAAATLYSLLLATEDNGKTWYEAHSRIRSAVLDQIQFFDLENGWIAGHHLTGFPRDPFLLVTRDGGKTWNERPLYSDTRAGAIEAFTFDSKTHGLLWLDRSQADGGGYETLESQTGGESWAVRETGGKPPLPKRRPTTASGGWRFRVDAAGKAYRLERQAGERWERVASFLVQPGECKEPESPPEPAPEARPETKAPPGR